MRTQQTSRVFFACLVLGAIPGCIPGVAWLPDSSGFIFTKGKASCTLVYFDMAQQQERVLVEDTEAPTLLPAVSPDGKLIAVAREEGERNDHQTRLTLQVIVYDIQGREKQRSPKKLWIKAHSSDLGIVGPYLFWAPGGDKILVTASWATGIYDVKNNRVHFVQEETLPACFGPSPISPDGKGFLACRLRKREIWKFLWLDWEGQAREFALPPDFMTDKKIKNRIRMLECPFLYSSGWEGRRAFVRAPEYRGDIDTDKLKAVFTNVEPLRTEEQAIIWQQFGFSKTKVQVRWVKAEKNRFRVELLRPNNRKPEVLLVKTGGPLIPSPNQKFLALTSLRDILVLDEHGKVVKRLEIEQRDP